MITDEQGKEWLFQRLYDAGWRYVVGGLGTYVFLTQNEPNIVDGYFTITNIDEIYKCTDIKYLFPSLGMGDVINIAEELGIADWSKVKVDTPVLVKHYEQDKWEKRYFAYFKDGRVYAWLCGTTSWSADCKGDTTSWNLAKLAKV